MIKPVRFWGAEMRIADEWVSVAVNGVMPLFFTQKMAREYLAILPKMGKTRVVQFHLVQAGKEADAR